MLLTRRRVLSAAIVWFGLGALGVLALTGRGPVIASVPGEIALVLPAIPIYVFATRFEAAPASEGALWAAVHGPPFLKPWGVAVVYFLPALMAVVCLFVGRRVRRADRSVR